MHLKLQRDFWHDSLSLLEVTVGGEGTGGEGSTLHRQSLKAQQKMETLLKSSEK